VALPETVTGAAMSAAPTTRVVQSVTK